MRIPLSPLAGRLLLALVSLSLCSTAGAQQVTPDGRIEKELSQYSLDRWTTDQGLPQNIVPALAQTSDGYLWAATQEGLARFDGLRFRTFDRRDGALTESHVSAVADDHRGGVWVGTVGGHLAHYANGRFTAFSRRTTLPSGQVRALLVDRSGALWFGIGDGGLGRFAHGLVAYYGATQGITGRQVTALHEDAHGDIWVGFKDGPAVRARVGRDATPVFSQIGGLVAGHVTSFASTPNLVWVGMREGGIAVVSRGRVRRTYTEADGLPTRNVLALAADSAGTLWVGFDRGGLGRIVEDRVSTLSSAKGLGHDVVRSLLIDREGSLWIGTSGGGLHRLRDGSITPYSVLEGLGAQSTMTVFEDRTGAVWVGTEGGGVSRIVGGHVERTFTTADGLPSNVVYAIAETPDGSLWFGTDGGGLVRYQNGRFRAYRARDGLSDDTVYGIYVDRSGTLWASTGNGLVRFRENVFTPFRVADGLSSDLVTAVVEDARGNLWVGTYDHGLNVIRQGRVVAQFGTLNGLRSNSVIALHESPAGDVWVGTNGGGLHRIRDGRVTPFGAQEGLPNDKIFAIVDDGAGRLWLTSNHGLVSVRTDELNAVAARRLNQVRLNHYGKADGLRSTEFTGGVQPSAWRGRDGRLWFPTTDGVASILPRLERTSRIAPTVRIEEVLAGSLALPLIGEAQVGAGARRFEFRYVGLSLRNPEQVHYRYRLDGVDERWVDGGTRREASYTNLAPGRYVFHVMAANADGVWSEQEATFSFELRPFFYQTGWFALLMGLAAAGALALLYRLRVNHLHRRQQELEREVAAQTVQIRAERDRAEEASMEAHAQRADAEAARALVEVQADQLREMDRIKTRFFNNLSHELRTPLTLTIGPLENALIGEYGEVPDEMQQQLSVVLRNSRRLLRLINQLLELAKIDAGKATLHPQHGDLVSFVEGIVLAFSAFAQNRNIDLAFEPEEDVMPGAFDPECVEKVVYNLLSNAVKFTPEGGHITVGLGARDLVVDGHLESGVALSVRDTGAGIAAEELPYIFDRFHRAEGTHSTVQEGTGIGLALVQDLVRLHGGSVEVSSAPGEGTEFRVLIRTDYAPAGGDGQSVPALVYSGPLMEAEVVYEEPQAVEALEAPGLPVVLVVDDNQDVRNFVASSLRGRFSIRTAVDGQDALEQIEASCPDLIVSDVMMPRLDGHGLCRAVRSDPRFEALPFILLTAKASSDERVEGLEEGASDYLAKPFNSRELIARIRNLLTLKSQREDLLKVNAALVEAKELKSKLIRIVSHDLKSPLSGVKTLIEMVSEDGGTLAEDRATCEIITESVDQMIGLITRVLEAEAFEGGMFELRREPLDMEALVRQIAEAITPLAVAKGQQITVEAVGAPLWVSADRAWLRTAIENVVSNAVKYSRRQGTIRLFVQADEGHVRLRVEDDGPGIKPEEQAKLFQAFARLSSMPTGGESSTGVGLSITKQVMDLHGGAILVENMSQGGSAFTLELQPIEAGELLEARSV